VIYQPPYNSKYYSGINPYALGFNMFIDIRRICENPTDEDREWFPEIAGKDWLDTVHFAMHNFKDESFISQFLSPKLMRDLKLFSVLDDDQNKNLEVSAIHNKEGYINVRENLSAQYNLANLEPNIQVYQVDTSGDRSLTLRYVPQNRVPLADDHGEVLRHMHRLWGFDIKLEHLNEFNIVNKTSYCPVKETNTENSVAFDLGN
jgi:spore cortex formation protein SpoVR/YcgB (stage V sporulation)